MIHTVARTPLAFFFTFLFWVSLPLLAQTDPRTETSSTSASSTDKDATTSKGKDKDRQKKAKPHRKKNSNVEDIGTRDINKGGINFFSLEKEIAMGRQLAAEVEKQVKLSMIPRSTNT